MKGMVLGLVVGAGFAFAAASAAPPALPVYAQSKGSPAASEKSTVMLSTPLADGSQQLLVFDPTEQVLCVYHVNAKSGEITLKSIRNIHWDMRMTQFNGVTPLPEEIRSLVEQR
ncbi:MAG: hypothetical protein K8T25_20060 [Planctomycetia bacterium]|nr:hypothetical protein [Planctomycetia bacterium]